MSPADADRVFMAEAIAQARLGRYSCSPNPRVGCVISREGQRLGAGFHRRAGGAHAEIEALNNVGAEVAGATVYVTLEPCSHHGRTGPCADALIAARVARVVVASVDPNPLVAGQGLARLRAAGIEVEQGLLDEPARALNPGYFKRMHSGLPWLRCKLAMSLDGRTAMADGDSQWITGAAARHDVQRLRAASCALLSGIGTVLHDDPRLDVREDPLDGLEVGRQPVRVIVDSQLRLPPGARLLGIPGEVVVATACQHPAREQALIGAGVTIAHLPGENGRVDLLALLRHLGAAQCNEVLLEAGATLSGAALQAGLVDELVIYLAPLLLGSTARPLLELALERMVDARSLQIQEIVAVGADWRISARPRRNGED